MMKYIVFLLLTVYLNVNTFAGSNDPIEIGRITGFKVDKLQKDFVKASFNIEIKNNTGRSFNVKLKKGKLRKNDDRLGDLKLQNKIHISNEQKSTVTLKVKVQFDEPLNLMKEGAQALFSKKAPAYSFSGIIRVSKFIFVKKIPFEFSKQLNLSDFG